VKLVFLVEERSMAVFLEGFLPRILGSEVPFRVLAHEGKSDLERSIPRKLRGWREPGVRFVVVRDQDSADCVDVKRKLVALCAEGRRPDSVVRVACRELESWFLGDLVGVAEALGVPALAVLVNKAKYRNPDGLRFPSRELARLLPGYGKIRGARAMGPTIDLDRCRSRSFGHFHTGVVRALERA
jgi:hypothetical protein